jgi:predicted MFS family arabinose efflux permease
LTAVFGVDDATAGLLMSIVVLPGVILAIPTGSIVNRIGFRLAGIVALTAITIGSIVTALSTSFAMAILGRFILGSVSTFLIIGTLNIISDWFSKKQMGTAIGLLGTANSLGMIVAFWAVPLLTQTYGWQTPFFLGAILALTCGILFAALMRNMQNKTEQTENRGQGLGPCLRNWEVWKICLMWFFFNLASLGFIVWAPTLLSTFKGLTSVDASLISSVYIIVGLILTPILGYVADRFGHRKHIAIVSLLLMAVSMPLLIFMDPNTIIGGVLVVGVFSSAMITLPNVLMAGSLYSKDKGFGFGLMSLFYRAASILSAPLIGYFIQISNSMVVPIVLLSTFSVIGGLFAFFLKSGE